MIETHLSKQEALEADPKAIQQINFTGNLDRQELQECLPLLKKQQQQQQQQQQQKIHKEL